MRKVWVLLPVLVESGLLNGIEKLTGKKRLPFTTFRNKTMILYVPVSYPILHFTDTFKFHLLFRSSF